MTLSPVSAEQPMKAKDLAPLVRLRVRLGPGVDFGPGKADLLEGIRETGSISAAGRRMRMSYKRAWHRACTRRASRRLRAISGSSASIGPRQPIDRGQGGFVIVPI